MPDFLRNRVSPRKACSFASPLRCGGIAQSAIDASCLNTLPRPAGSFHARGLISWRACGREKARSGNLPLPMRQNPFMKLTDLRSLLDAGSSEDSLAPAPLTGRELQELVSP